MLYVEDEESDTLFMQRAFASLGLSAALNLVADGRAAIKYLSGDGVYAKREAHPIPDLVLLDLSLPAVHGFDVLRWIRRHPDYSRLPVVIFSGTTHDSDKQQAQELGATDFIQKPNSGLKFPEVVRKLKEKWL